MYPSLAENRLFFGILLGVCQANRGVEIDLVSSRMDDLVNMRGHLAAHNSADKSHQSRRFPQLSASNRLNHHDKGVVDLVVQFLRAELAA